MLIKRKLEERVEGVLENLYLVLMACWIGFFFLNTTTFENMRNVEIYNLIKVGLIVLILLRAYVSKGTELIELSLIFVISAILLIAADKNGYVVLSEVLLMILGARGISFRKIVKVYFVVIAGLLSFTIIMAVTGQIENFVYYQAGRRPRMAFGVAYPTDFSAYIFYGLLAYGYLRGKRIKYFELGVMVIVGGLVYWFCDARLNTICIMSLVAVLGYNKIMNDRCTKQGKEYKMNGVWSGILSVSPVICGCFMTVLCLLYSADNALLVKVNHFLNNRLMYGNKGIVVYGYSLWGQSIPMQGNGGTTEVAKHYFFLDSSYLYIGLQYGLIILALILFIWLCIGAKARMQGDWLLLWMIAIVAGQCIIEHHMLEVPYSVFLWAALSRVGAKKMKKNMLEYAE